MSKLWINQYGSETRTTERPKKCLTIGEHRIDL